MGSSLVHCSTMLVSSNLNTLVDLVISFTRKYINVKSTSITKSLTFSDDPVDYDLVILCTLVLCPQNHCYWGVHRFQASESGSPFLILRWLWGAYSVCTGVPLAFSQVSVGLDL